MTEYHYCYKIEFETGHVYFGSRSCKCKPEDDVKYLGSPKTHKTHWEAFEPVKVILREFDTRKEACEYENVLIEWAWSVNKSLSLNANIQGVKFCTKGATQSEETVLKKSKPYKFWNPAGEIVEGINLQKFCRDNNLIQANMLKLLKNKTFNCFGYTNSREAHLLYKEAFKDRGISWYSGRQVYEVVYCPNRVRNKKQFKTKEEAIKYRDSLCAEGYEFKVILRGWKQKLEEIKNNGGS